MSLKETEDNLSNTPTTTPHALKRRRVSMFRRILIFALTATFLILFVFWYRDIPQGMDCLKMTQRVAAALNSYHDKHHKLPPILAILDVREGRYRIEHYEYWFAGFGGPDYIPSGTIIAYCTRRHEPLFGEPWRHIILMVDGKMVATNLSEEKFQEAIKNQPSAETYLKLRVKSTNNKN